MGPVVRAEQVGGTDVSSDERRWTIRLPEEAVAYAAGYAQATLRRRTRREAGGYPASGGAGGDREAEGGSSLAFRLAAHSSRLLHHFRAWRPQV